MSTAEIIAFRDGVPDNASPSRAVFDVSLTGNTPEISRANLVTLLHSPIGVYVVHTEFLRGSVLVRFDIAFEDLAFTLHTLLATLPEAIIGAVQCHELAEAC